jgi:hypothetical protein
MEPSYVYAGSAWCTPVLADRHDVILLHFPPAPLFFVLHVQSRDFFFICDDQRETYGTATLARMPRCSGTDASPRSL